MNLIAVDIGNSLIKIGVSEATPGATPADSWTQLIRCREADEITESLPANAIWVIASVQAKKCESLLQWIARIRPRDSVYQLSHRDLPIAVRVDHPQRVGIDRLCAALAARYRRPNRCPAIIISLGTAVTVDAIDTAGEFLGGTISLGRAGCLAALHNRTNQLPDLTLPAGDFPYSPFGKSTEQAIWSGVTFSIVGGIQEIVGRQLDILGSETQIYLTGGDALQLRPLLKFSNELVEYLVLEGVRWAGWHHLETRR